MRGGTNEERFKSLVDAIVENRTTSGIKASTIDRLKKMHQTYPELFSEDVFTAMGLLAKESNKLNAYEMARILAPLYNVSIIKNFTLLNDRDQTKSQIRELLEIFAESVAIVLQVSAPGFKMRFLSTLNAEMTFKDIFSDTYKRGQATITVPPMKNEKQLRLPSDVNHAIVSNLKANHDALKSAPIQTFQFYSEQKNVIFDSGILSIVISKLVAFQNAINNHNFSHYIVQKPFLKIESSTVSE